MTAPARQNPVLAIISDRPNVWVGFRSPYRTVRRWVGERESDEERASRYNFTGDPTDHDTYRWTTGVGELSAVVDLQDYARAQGAINALRKLRPEVGVLVITAGRDLDAADIDVARKLAWTDALRGDLEGELRNLEALRRLHELRRFAEGDADVPILMHPDPDPDALASALAVRALLRKPPQQTPIITLGEMTRPENRRMSELLRMRVTVVTEQEAAKLARLIAVDFLPRFEAGGERPRMAVIDHHPHDDTDGFDFLDLRPNYGATATLMLEYLRLEDERRIARPLATALLYGIKTDTDSLGRGAISADVEAYAFLQGRADLTLLRKLERPSYSVETARLYGEALRHMKSEEDVAIAFLGRVRDQDAHVLADIADFCLALEEITWAVAGALIDDKLVLTIRHLGGGAGAGDLAKRFAQDSGDGGGHATMARAVLEPTGDWAELRDADAANGPERLLKTVCAQLSELRLSHQSPHPAHQETAPTAAP